MSDLETALTLVDRLSLAEKAILMERLSAALKSALEVEAYRRMPWPEFIARTAGSLATDPLARPPQLAPEEREPLE